MITRASSGIDAIDTLSGRTCVVLSWGVDSDVEAWLELWVDGRRYLAYETDIELTSI